MGEMASEDKTMVTSVIEGLEMEDPIMEELAMEDLRTEKYQVDIDWKEINKSGL